MKVGELELDLNGGLVESAKKLLIELMPKVLPSLKMKGNQSKCIHFMRRDINKDQTLRVGPSQTLIFLR